MSAPYVSGPEIVAEWREVRRFLDGVGLRGLPMRDAVVALAKVGAKGMGDPEVVDAIDLVANLTNPADAAELAAAVARHPAGRNRRPSLSVVPEVTG